GVLELRANRAVSSTFESNRCYIVCDTHPSFVAFAARYEPITNPDTSGHGGFSAPPCNQKFSFHFFAPVWVMRDHLVGGRLDRYLDHTATVVAIVVAVV